ncbi:hypothetical protein RND71_043342 [Anisodus tanguticus]|uniref:Hypoxia up-regulated protein 1 n=1 Tax=Anisodus tanguticus TaxID=243964 RepID=A0AAE1QPV8_9SOLA|nr:hypothetical protein RND71_043342 [Anisodus tanguticus]
MLSSKPKNLSVKNKKKLLIDNLKNTGQSNLLNSADLAIELDLRRRHLKKVLRRTIFIMTKEGLGDAEGDINGATLAVLSIDLGNENVKIGVVSPGKNMETVLNTDSSRKTPLAVAFRDGERFFLEAALTTTPELIVRGVGFDRTLGGFEMQLRLRDHLAKLFAEQSKKPLKQVLENNRAMSKLFKEAGKVKNMLSANNEILVRIENVMNDIDLKAPVKRSEFEDICADLLNERVTKPIESALLSSGLTIAEIEQIILFGGNTRTPKIQQLLLDLLQDKELGKNVNSDEAASLAGAYLAGKLSKGFKAKDFIITDYNLFPIAVEFNRKISENEEKTIQRVLYSRGNSYPMKKIFTFNKKNSDFDFLVKYGDLSFLSKDDQSYIGDKNLMKISLSNFDRFINNYQDETKYEAKGVKAHFSLNENGILVLTNAEYLYNEKVKEEVLDSNVVSDTLSNIGSKLGSFFSSNTDKQDEEVQVDKDVQNITEEKIDPSAVNLTENTNSSQVNVTKTKVEIKIKPIKEKIDFNLDFNFKFGSKETLKNSLTKLEDLKKQESLRLARDQAKNSLESFIVETKTKLYDDEYEKSSTEEEREKLMKILNDASEWLEFESDNVETKVLNDKLTELATSFDEIYKRVEEHRERPNLLKVFDKTIENSQTFLDKARSLGEEKQGLTDLQLNQLETLLTNVNKWKNEKVLEQEKTPLYETPKLTIFEITEKINVVNVQVRNLINIAKQFKPKVKEQPVPEKTKEENKNSTEENKNEENKDEENKNEDNKKTVDENEKLNLKPDTSEKEEKSHSEL